MRLLISTLLATSLISAQDTRGTISGTVADSQSAVIAAASVQVANTGTGSITRLTTNHSGYYEAPLLLPGTYTVTVEAPGFKKSVRSGVTLTHSDQLQINFQMELGGVTESVTVTGEPPMLETGTVSTGRTLTHREVLDLPVLGNNIVMLTRIAPGVQVPGTTQFLVQGQVGGGSGYYAPGNVGGNEWSIDGASTNGTERRVSYMPSPDVVGEFKIETSNFDASFGHSTGLNISMSTRPGANALHGSATYQYFNQRWNAASFFVKQSRYQQIAVARAANNFALADSLANTPLLAPGHTNNYAGTVSGPVYIPKVIDGRNKLFFFLGYSRLINLQSARPSELNYTVPTAAMRSGNFAPLLQVDPVRYAVYDPNSTRADAARAGHFVRDPFPGNVIPSTRFRNPLYDFYAKRMPLPNNDPTDARREPVNNYLVPGMPNNVFHRNVNNRIDYALGQNHRFFFRWQKSWYLEDAQDYTYQSETGLMAWNEKRPSQNAGADWTYTISPTTILNVSADINQFIMQNQRLGTRKYKPTDVGLPAYMDTKCDASCVLPRVVWPGMTAWSGDMVLGVTVDAGATGRQQSLKFNFTHIRNNHSFKAGIDFRQHYRTLLQNGGLTSGNFTFANNFVRKDEDGNTPAGTLGLVWATFLLGIPTGMSVDTNDTYALMSPYYAFYGQDTWRVTRNLTITLGLRAEYERGATERYNRAISYFDPNLELPISAAAQAAYARNPLPEVPAAQFLVKGGSVYAGRNGVPRELWRNELMWLPRISAAWQANARTVIRGGYGIYYDTLNVLNQAADQSGFSRATNTVLTNDFGTNWLVGDPKNGVSPLTNPFPVRSDGTRFDAPLRDALGAMARVGQGFTFTGFDRKHARVQRWRIGAQRELSSNMVVEAAYWGQWGDQISLTHRLDALPEKYWATGNARNNALATELNRNVPNPFYIGNFDSLRTSNPVLYQQLSTLGQFQSTTIQKNRLLRPFPHMNGLNVSSDPGGKARTHALEVNFQRRFSKGLTMNASYSRMLQENKTIFENEFDAAPSIWWVSDTARPHRFTATGIYELPFGKGRRFVQRGLLNHLVGGFQVAATYEFQPGPLLAWGNIFYYGDVNTLEADATSTPKTLDQWFNTGLKFERNASNLPAAFHRRIFPRFFNGLRADGLNQWNANVLREFKIVERIRFQIRADAINIQNRSQMAGPELSPTSTNFGRITSQTSSLNRFYQIQARLHF
ncbi:MAG: carboxypeptidase regulatory-like domain-containing protein [Candidatus Solibacter usitatus]|nr:carboxypeptidase regulatory-like domain-containing protein [Candidatus Solibacter usitatus]